MPPTAAPAIERWSEIKTVEKAMRAKLKGSDIIKDADIAILGFTPMTKDMVDPADIEARRAGFVIPYFKIDGTHSDFYRFRYLEPVSGFAALTKEGEKPTRYVQPAGSLNELYMPPVGKFAWKTVADDPSIAVVITEGELKAACACINNRPTIGLGGVWCFRSAREGLRLLPQFYEFNWDSRQVFICYDSDASTNPLVIQAENALAAELLTLGARPYITRLQPLADGSKCGIDDLIVLQGLESFDEALVNSVEWAAAKELFQLNEEVVYVADPGVVLRLDTGQRMAVRAFIDHAYADRTYVEQVGAGSDKMKLIVHNAAKAWISWPSRSVVHKVTYAPGQPRITEENELNCWHGWGCRPIAGSVRPWNELLEYLFEGAEDARKWFEQWLAYPLQNPGEKLYSAVVVWGVQQGTGKTLVGHTMFRIYGRNATEIGDRDLYSPHNEWAEHRQFVVGDEITGGDKRSSADRMKSMITQRLLRLNPKYIPSYTVPDCINYYFTSNHPDAFFLEDTDRRFFIHEIKAKPLHTDFYKGYVDWLDNDLGAEHLFHHLLHLDLSGFSPQGHAPTTDSKREMIADGRSDLGNWVADLRHNPDQLLVVAGKALPYKLWTTSELHSIYDPEQKTRVTVNGLARELKRAGFRKVADGVGIYTASLGQQRLWAIRDTEELLTLTGKQASELFDRERGGLNGKRSKY